MVKNTIVYLSTYPPRKCGIATFTQDLAVAVDKVYPHANAEIIALNDNGNIYDYPENVIYQINGAVVEEYREVAEKINDNDDIQLVCVQHEFKVFGSEHGENLLVFLDTVKKPVVTTFHTVLPNPSHLRKKIVRSIVEGSARVIVMNKLAIDILKNDYGVKTEIAVIPHGIHDVPYKASVPVKKELRLEDKQLITSFGFLRPGRGERSSGKGYELVLDALPNVIKQFPNVLYLIIGVTHPMTLKKEGEEYLDFLKNKVKELGLKKHVRFINRYLSLQELLTFLQATDIYISSNNNPQQITSGTLVYAMGCGRAVIATPYLHAKEIVTSARGILAKFGDSSSFTDAMIRIISDPSLQERMGRNAYAFTRNMTWSSVAAAYINVFNGFIQPHSTAAIDSSQVLGNSNILK